MSCPYPCTTVDRGRGFRFSVAWMALAPLVTALAPARLPAQTCDTTCAQIAVGAAVWAVADVVSRSEVGDDPRPSVGVVDRPRWRASGFTDEDLDRLGSRLAEASRSELAAGSLRDISRCALNVPPAGCPAEFDWVYAGVGPPRLVGDDRAEVGAQEIYSRLGVITVLIEMRRDDNGTWAFYREIFRTAHDP